MDANSQTLQVPPWLSFTMASKVCTQAGKTKTTFKKGSKDDPKSYRPISLLPQLSKIIEKTIHNQEVQKYLDEKKILYRYQSGFRAHHSTDTCLSYLNDKILKGFEAKMFTGMILIDLQKALDTIDHEIFLDKMACLGFSNSTILWFNPISTAGGAFFAPPPNTLFYIARKRPILQPPNLVTFSQI